MVDIPGKAFSHWSKTVDGTEAFDFNTTITEDTTLYAVLADRWKVTFDTQGGTTIFPKYIVNNQELGVVEAPVRTGYTFSRWNTNTDGSGIDYTNSSIITSDTRLYAVWTPQSVAYTIIYWQENANNTYYTYKETAYGSGLADSIIVLTGNSIETTKYNYFTFKEYDQGVVLKGDGTSVVNVYYSRNSYTVRFDLNRTNATLTIGEVTYYDSNDPKNWYSFSAKYDSDISDLWPTATNIPNVTSSGTTYYFYGWPSDGSHMYQEANLYT